MSMDAEAQRLHRGSWSLEAQGTYGLTLTPAGG